MKILVIDKIHPLFFKEAELMGCMCDYRPEIGFEEIQECIAHYEGLIVRNKKINAALLERAHKLQFIGRAGAGLDNIDLVQAEKQQITVVNASEANADAVAEHTMGMLLGLLHKINFSHQKLRKLEWNREAGRGEELKSKTVAIIGYGVMGTATAQRLLSFGCKVMFYDINPEKPNPFVKVQRASLEQVFEEADIVSLHIPYTTYNKYWVNQALINNFKKNIYLLNVARGEVADTQALINALQTGKLKGAALDVFENEDIYALTDLQRVQLETLIEHPMVIFTPHVAGWSVESFEKISSVLIHKLQDFIKNH